MSAYEISSIIPLWLDGKEVTTTSTFDVISPVDNKVVHKSSAASSEDAIKAIESSQKAFESWSQTKPTERRDIFLRAAEIFKKRKQELHEYAEAETGLPEMVSNTGFDLAYQNCIEIAGLVNAVHGEIIPSTEPGKSALMFKEPYGVILSIGPWNSPYVLGFRACLQPLAMGNTVVLKGPEASPATYWAIASVMHEAGLPAGCLNTIIHRREDAVEIASTMIAHPYVKKINFTGSTTVGAALASLAGKYLKPTLMELGGKAPSIICEDADINKAAIECAKGAFIHAGQICMSTERIIVHENILSEFRTALKGAMDKVSSLMGVPQLINAQSVEKNEGYISDAVAKGAKALYSDAKPTEELKTRMAPVIIEGVKPGMNLYHTESFGPTVSLIAVSSDEEALRVANDTAYGLSASIFSRDLRKALRMSRKIETGAVHINSMTIHDEAALPHGGVKDSGFGRFNGLRGLEEWVWTRVVTYDE